MASAKGKSKLQWRQMAYYNMVLTEAIFQLLEEKGLMTRAEAKQPALWLSIQGEEEAVRWKCQAEFPPRPRLATPGVRNSVKRPASHRA